MKEIKLRKEYLDGEPVKTIYFGGGTPSMLPETDLLRIMDVLREHFEVMPAAEISFEANPDDMDPRKLPGWIRQGINRLSIGIQSFFDEDLVWMNRAHSSSQANNCITDAQNAGFSNISVDLIYGGPTLPDEHWKRNLAKAVGLEIPHLSCYALTVEPGTALDTLTRKKKLQPVSPDDQARQFGIMTRLLDEQGYEHYEISNFALPGKRSRHNSSYWSGETYLGLGPSAHSFNGCSRQWNVSNNALYINALNKNEVPAETEHLSTRQRFNEYIMTSIRTLEGTDLDLVEQRFGVLWKESLLRDVTAITATGRIAQSGNRIVLTPQGKLFADGIASELFRLEDPVLGPEIPAPVVPVGGL